MHKNYLYYKFVNIYEHNFIKIYFNNNKEIHFILYVFILI